MTRTYAKLEVSKEAYAEVAGALQAAGYDHVFRTEGNVREIIDMDGIALVAAKAAAPRSVPPVESKATIAVVSCSQDSDPWSIEETPYAAAIYIDGSCYHQADHPLGRQAWELTTILPVCRIIECQVQWEWFESRHRQFPCQLTDVHPDAWLPEASPEERLATSMSDEQRYAPRPGSVPAPVRELPF